MVFIVCANKNFAGMSYNRAIVYMISSALCTNLYDDCCGFPCDVNKIGWQASLTKWGKKVSKHGGMGYLLKQVDALLFVTPRCWYIC